ncbi:MAG: hypothetical protein ACREV4_10940 [Gammaproteobacteria bacterium]
MLGLDQTTLGRPSANAPLPDYVVARAWDDEARLRGGSSLGRWLSDEGTGFDSLAPRSVRLRPNPAVARGVPPNASSLGKYSWGALLRHVPERSSEPLSGATSGLSQSKQVGESVASEQVQSATELRLPYSAIIQAALASGDVTAARTLLAVAMSTEEPSGSLVNLGRLLLAPSVQPVARQESTKASEMRWLVEHAASHRGRWVALRGTTLLAAEDTLAALLVRVAQLRLEERPLIHRL